MNKPLIFGVCLACLLLCWGGIGHASDAFVVKKTAPYYSGPGVDYQKLGTLYKNKIICVTAISQGWLQFMVLDQVAYIQAGFVEKSERSSLCTPPKPPGLGIRK